MDRRGGFGLVNFLLLVAVIGGGFFAVLHRQEIIDWWRLSNYQPTAAVVQIADQTAMTQKARDLFYISDPQIEERETFNQRCRSQAEHGKVLGCYSGQKIYVFNVTDPRLAGVVEVTAAHEMLHAAYERLDSQTKAQVDSLVQAQAAALKDDKKLQDLLAVYAKAEPGEENNELHSILATEYASLTGDLEAYYARYFSDRNKVIAYQKAYNAEFDASKARILSYQRQLDTLKSQVDSNTRELESRTNELTSESARMDTLRSSDPETYNRRVPEFNAKVQEYNRLARSTQTLVDEYNAIVPKIKNEIALQEDLNQSLDSKYKPVQAQ